MNTLLGELATLNDIQYPRYRIAFKLRKLQKALLLDQLDVGTLQEALHLSGVGGMGRKEVVPVPQLCSLTSELYSCLRVQRPILGHVQLQQAQELCSNWLQMNYMCSTGGRIEAGSLKVTLCLLTGSKSPEKARHLFGILANSNGAVGCPDLAYFCAATQQLAGTLQEQLYTLWAGPKHLWRDSLVHVRSAEDIQDDECDGGGIRRQWLSQFEFTKLFSTSPLPGYLAWMVLYHRMPSMEKVLHPVRCAICTRKPIVAFRYQCTQCNNFNLCQMCFLKNRLTDKHTEDHEMMEFSSASQGHRSWHSRILGNGHARGGKLWTEPKSPFVYSPRSSVTSIGKSKKTDQTDSPMQAIEDMLSSSQKLENTQDNHHPTVIHIGSPQHSKKQIPPTTTTANQKRISVGTNSSGSPDSVSSSGGKFHYEPSLSSASSGGPGSISSTSDVQLSPAHLHNGRRIPAVVVQQEKVRSQSVQHERKTPQPEEDLTVINKRLSLELDMLLNDLPPPGSYATLPAKFTTAHKVPLRLLQAEEKALEGQVTSLTSKREQLTGELEGLISQVQSKSLSLGRTPDPSSSPISRSPLVAPAHSRSDSLPAEAYLGGSAPSSPSVSPLLSHKCASPTHLSSPTYNIHHRSQELRRMTPDLPDSLAEYAPTDLDDHTPAKHDMHRISVAW